MTFIKKNISRLLGLCLIFFATGSCTFDYFENEINFRIHIPQMEHGEISNFYVAFHATNDRHVITRKVEAPFEQDEFTRQGIMRFKLPPGQYEVSCFADYDRESITEGQDYTSSYKGAQTISRDNSVYRTSQAQTRALFMHDVTVYPIDHPASQNIVEADINEDCLFKGKISSVFEGLPASVAITNMVVTYKGLATSLGFDGVFKQFSATDTHNYEFITNSAEGGNLTISNYIFPSEGVSHIPRDGTRTDNGQSIGMKIDFYNGSSWVGDASFTEDDLAALAPADKPKDENGNPVTDLILYPRENITFIFKGFTLVGITLSDWGDIVSGGGDMH